jgi:hypothetical protein
MEPYKKSTTKRARENPDFDNEDSVRRPPLCTSYPSESPTSCDQYLLDCDETPSTHQCFALPLTHIQIESIRMFQRLYHTLQVVGSWAFSRGLWTPSMCPLGVRPPNLETSVPPASAWLALGEDLETLNHVLGMVDRNTLGAQQLIEYLSNAAMLISAAQHYSSMTLC